MHRDPREFPMGAADCQHCRDSANQMAIFTDKCSSQELNRVNQPGNPDNWLEGDDFINVNPPCIPLAVRMLSCIAHCVVWHRCWSWN